MQLLCLMHSPLVESTFVNLHRDSNQSFFLERYCRHIASFVSGFRPNPIETEKQKRLRLSAHEDVCLGFLPCTQTKSFLFLCLHWIPTLVGFVVSRGSIILCSDDALHLIFPGIFLSFSFVTFLGLLCHPIQLLIASDGPCRIPLSLHQSNFSLYSFLGNRNSFSSPTFLSFVLLFPSFRIPFLNFEFLFSHTQVQLIWDLSLQKVLGVRSQFRSQLRP